MKKSKKNSKTDWVKADAYVNTPADYDESPEWTAEMFERADLYHGEKLIRRGKRGRPRKAQRSKAKTISLRLNPKVNSYFRATGKGWQTRINTILQQWIAKHPLA
jgi:uncharacterized protein (DUF4415 family)